MAGTITSLSFPDEKLGEEFTLEIGSGDNAEFHTIYNGSESKQFRVVFSEYDPNQISVLEVFVDRPLGSFDDDYEYEDAAQVPTECNFVRLENVATEKPVACHDPGSKDQRVSITVEGYDIMVAAHRGGGDGTPIVQGWAREMHRCILFFCW